MALLNAGVPTHPQQFRAGGAAGSLALVQGGRHIELQEPAARGPHHGTGAAAGALLTTLMVGQVAQLLVCDGVVVRPDDKGPRYDDCPGKISAAAGVSHYQGRSAIAVGLGGTLENGLWRMNGGLSVVPTLGKSDVGVVIGVSCPLN